MRSFTISCIYWVLYELKQHFQQVYLFLCETWYYIILEKRARLINALTSEALVETKQKNTQQNIIKKSGYLLIWLNDIKCICVIDKFNFDSSQSHPICNAIFYRWFFLFLLPSWLTFCCCICLVRAQYILWKALNYNYFLSFLFTMQ